MNRPALPWIAYPPALSKGSPVARYSSISSSLITPTWTNVDSTKLRRSPSGNRTNETPVMTECVIPESDCSICRPSSVVRGLPRICVPISTAVSAAITIAGPTDRAATSSAFASANRATIASADSPGIGVSSIADDTTENAYPALRKISARLGEADASISLVVTTSPEYTTRRTESACAKGQEASSQRNCHPERSEGSQTSTNRKTSREVAELKNDGFLVFAELLAEGVGNFADRGVRLDGGEDGGHQVFAAAGAAGQFVQCGFCSYGVALCAHRFQPSDLVAFDSRIDAQCRHRMLLLRDEIVHA